MKNISFPVLLFLLLLAGSCTQSSNTAPQRLKDQIVKANEELFNKGNVDFADEVFADNYKEIGPKFIKAGLAELRKAFPDLQVEVGPIIAEGNMTGWRRIHTGTHRGTIMGFAPSGKQITWEAIILSRYENGKVVEEWGQSNLLEVLQGE